MRTSAFSFGTVDDSPSHKYGVNQLFSLVMHPEGHGERDDACAVMERVLREEEETDADTRLEPADATSAWLLDADIAKGVWNNCVGRPMQLYNLMVPKLNDHESGAAKLGKCNDGFKLCRRIAREEHPNLECRDFALQLGIQRLAGYTCKPLGQGNCLIRLVDAKAGEYVTKLGKRPLGE